MKAIFMIDGKPFIVFGADMLAIRKAVADLGITNVVFLGGEEKAPGNASVKGTLVKIENE